MKIRTDFVSNSSSSSFVVAVDFSRYKFSDFVETVCDNCDDLDSEYHDPGNKDHNAGVLGYCAKKYELLFLGSLCAGRKRKTYRRRYNWEDEYDGKDDEDSPFQCAARSIGRNCTQYGMGDNYKAWYEGPDTIVCEWDDLVEDAITVSSEDMSRIRTVAAHESDNSSKLIVRNILDYVNTHVRTAATIIPCGCVASTYKITMNTILNTKEMLCNGVDLRLDNPEKVNKLEARLNAGDDIICVECGAEGEVGGDTQLYSEHGTYCMENVPAEFINQDY